MNESVFKNGNQVEEMDLSNEGLEKRIADQGGQTEGEEAPETDESVGTDGAEETTESTEEESTEETEESTDESEESDENESAATADGIKTIDDAIKMHKDDQRFITKLQQENKELRDAISPLLSEKDGKLVLDTDKINDARSDNKGLSDEQLKKANENFWEQFDKNPIETLFKIVQNAQGVALKPYEMEMASRKQEGFVESLHKEKFGQFGDLRDKVKAVLGKDQSLNTLGKRGVEMAYNQVIADTLPEIIKGTGEEKKPEPKTTAPVGNGTVKQSSKKSASDQIKDKIFSAEPADSVFG